jgi:hypothetical protein
MARSDAAFSVEVKCVLVASFYFRSGDCVLTGCQTGIRRMDRTKRTIHFRLASLHHSHDARRSQDYMLSYPDRRYRRVSQ